MDKVTVIGAGSFGIAITKLLAHNVDVLVACRSEDTSYKINHDHFIFNTRLDHRIKATTSLEEALHYSKLIFPIVPSNDFSDMIRQAAPFLTPAHILIHGTKGFVLNGIDENDLETKALKKEQVLTMSELIRKFTSVLRIGCLSGPNLAKEILDEQPTATVVASEFD